ncbi:MAG: hypothetical protein ABW157_10895 [Candidatus Thiodiazotropha sp. LLP2]
MNRLAASWRLTNQKWYIHSLLASRREIPKKNSIYMALIGYTTFISPRCAEEKLTQVFIQIFHTLHVLFILFVSYDARYGAAGRTLRFNVTGCLKINLTLPTIF